VYRTAVGDNHLIVDAREAKTIDSIPDRAGTSDQHSVVGATHTTTSVTGYHAPFVMINCCSAAECELFGAPD